MTPRQDTANPECPSHPSTLNAIIESDTPEDDEEEEMQEERVCEETEEDDVTAKTTCSVNHCDDRCVETRVRQVCQPRLDAGDDGGTGAAATTFIDVARLNQDELNACSGAVTIKQEDQLNINAPDTAVDEDDSGHAVTSPSSVTSSSASSSPISSPIYYDNNQAKISCPSEPSHASSSSKNLSCNIATNAATSAHAQIDSLKSILRNYDQNQIYLAHISFLDWRDLPGKRSVDGERVWVVGAADHEGRHRTRLLVAGRHWRPRCLKHVNMLSQPVIYAGGGRGSLTADLFLWWFHHEFAITAMAMHPAGAILVAERADYLPSEVDCIAADGLVRLFIIPGQYVEPKLVTTELRIRLAWGILTAAIAESCYSEKSVQTKRYLFLDNYIKKFTLKEAFADLHRAWLAIRSETFSRSWVIMQDREENCTLANMSTGSLGLGASQRFFEPNDDHMLIVELQHLARDAGIDVDDMELMRWILDEESNLAKHIKKADAEEDVENEQFSKEDHEEDEENSPTAKEAVQLLSRILLWMEKEPLDPSLLLTIRSMRDTAAFMASKMGLTATHPSGLPFFCPNGDPLTQPPPAHMGIPPYGALDAGKAAAAAGLTRAPMYPFSAGQYPYPMLSPEMTQVAASWHTPSMYPISPASASFRSPYPTSLPISSSSLPTDLYRFSPTGLMPPHPGLSPHAHALASHALVSSAPKTDHSTLEHNHRSTIEQKNSTSLPSDNTKNQDAGQQNNQDKKKPHIKKPLNAFMLYMKEMRAKVVAECTLKESAAINQILGRRWHSLSREEQARYYEAARQERHLHQQRYPGWSARDNYGYGSKKKKRKKERSADPTGGREEQAKYYELARRERQLHMQLYPDWSSRANTNRTKKRRRKQDTNSDPGGNNMKKCRARYGLDQQSQWCKPCRRKKKCIRYMGEGGDGDGEGDGDAEDDHSEDNLGSVGEAGTPEEDESLSSPGGLSGLSSLASPSLVLPSPSSLASPCPLTPPVPPSNLPNPIPNPNSSQNQQNATQQPTTTAPPTVAPPTSQSNVAPPPQPPAPPPPHRNPVGTNPHDINNPLSVNQLTGQCIKSEVTSGPTSNPAISVT